jgi:hypothetical protein
MCAVLLLLRFSGTTSFGPCVCGCRREALNALFYSNGTAQWHDLICKPNGTLQSAGSGAAAPPAAEPTGAFNEAVHEGRGALCCELPGFA